VCLGKITNWCNNTSGVGYKRFWLNEGNALLGIMYSATKYQNRGYPINKWIRSGRGRHVKSYSSGIYRAGFHIYETMEEAIHATEFSLHQLVFKVKYKNLICSGIEINSKVIVAGQMLVTNELRYSGNKKGVFNRNKKRDVICAWNVVGK